MTINSPTEAEFQRAVIELANWNGWIVHHTRAAQIRPGVWATPIQGTAGFPDLILCRDSPGDFIVAELKKQGGKMSVLQKLWMIRLKNAGVETYCWFPKDLDLIHQRLARKL